MKLKKIILNGFKSFADKTAFDFEDGVTVVVGPNGCGKSNIVDAVRWVLGEQSAKSLRGGQMLDVIFNGSSTRKSSSMAEVTLVFENSQSILKTDENEVAVTRRLYRSGDSEYLLNNKACRLKDIRETFLDTGIGTDAYSIIEQGKVAVLLQASPQDRRSIFEEAAGISRYKARKKEALRKLERTEQNLLRLTDVIGELEKRLRSIKVQAGKARNYQTYSTRLKELRLIQHLSEYHQLRQDTETTAAELEAFQDELAGVNAENVRTQAQLSNIEHDLDHLEQQIQEHERELLQCTAQISTQEDRIEMGQRRCDELNQQLTRTRQQMHNLRIQNRQLQQDSAADRQQLEEIEEQLKTLQAELENLQTLRQDKALQLAESRAQLDDEKSGLIDIVRRTAQLHNEIQSLDVRRDSLSGQKDRLSDRSSQIADELTSLLTERAQYEEKLEQINVLRSESQEQLENKRQQLAQLGAERLACSEQLSAAKEYRSGLISRRQVLSDMEAKLEGVDKGVRQILEARALDPERYYYVRGMVAELLQAEVKYASIIEAALGERAQHLVAADSRLVIEDSDNLDELPGRVQIICLDRVGPYTNGFDLDNRPEVQARLIDLVKFSEENQKLAWHLLGKTILVDNIASAVKLAEQAPAGYRWVTLRGELLEADGTIHLGPQTAHTGLISRKSELRELDHGLLEAQDRIGELQNQTEQYATQADHLEKNLQELRTAIYEISTEEVETRGRLDRVDQNVQRLKQESPLIESEIATLEEQIEQAINKQSQSEQNLSELQTVNQQRQERVDLLEEQIRLLASEDQVVLDQITDMKVSVGQTQQKRLALRERISSIETQIRQFDHTMQSLRTDLNNAQSNILSSQRAILTAESALAELFMRRQEHHGQTVGLRKERDRQREEMEELRRLAQECHLKHEQVQENCHQAQMKLNEYRLRNESLIEKVREELSLDLVEYYQKQIELQKQARLAAERPGEPTNETPETEQPAAEQIADNDAPAEEESEAEILQRQFLSGAIDWQAVKAEIDDLRGKIERLGNINLDAITEQEELEKRADYLNQQATDLMDSREQLESLINRINEESVTRFQETFDAIRINFAELFRKLFGGGKAEITLLDPENILECGIEIVARPPGKQPQSISLLSGGEKTMTAVALLLAVFKSKPSPFCLLDEVDAALDEANNERFNLVIKEFLNTSQFVVITHARRTMSIADVIYGVTMQEQGVSKKVSVKFATDDDTDDGTAVA